MRFLYCFFLFLSFYRCNFIDTPLLLFIFTSILKITVLVTDDHFVMISLLSCKVITVTKCPPVIRTNLLKRNSSLSTVDDKFSFTRVRNVLASLITSIKSLEPPSYWYVNYLELNIVFLNL